MHPYKVNSYTGTGKVSGPDSGDSSQYNNERWYKYDYHVEDLSLGLHRKIQEEKN